jgi:hypothetical protein
MTALLQKSWNRRHDYLGVAWMGYALLLVLTR